MTHTWMLRFAPTLLPFITLLFSFTASANFEFSPIEARLQTEGQSSSIMAKIKSQVDKDVPVVVKVMARGLSEDGSEVRTATTDLAAFPQQFILKAKEERFIKILWKGPKTLDHEQAYRVLVENVPVDLTKEQVGKASIKIQINYAASFYVSSKPGIANVSITSVAKDKSGKNLDLKFENTGDAHLVIARPEMDLSCENAADKKIILKGPTIQKLEGINLLAKTKMNTSISVPNELTKCSAFKWAFRYKND